MLDHITIGVSNIEQSKMFYDIVLFPLGITRLHGEGEQFAGYGINPKAFFWIGIRDTPQTSVHIAFAARDRATVDWFYHEAIAAGGRDNGQPGLRQNYHPNYYGALFLILTVTISKRFAIRRKDMPLNRYYRS